jgi:hypothetical protein
MRGGVDRGQNRRIICFGGEGGIRTHEPREGPPVFKTHDPACWQYAVARICLYLRCFPHGFEAVFCGICASSAT